MIEHRCDKLLESDLPSVTELRDLCDQRKDELISALDSEILNQEEELVMEVCEAEDIKESILTSITHVTYIIDTAT